MCEFLSKGIVHGNLLLLAVPRRSPLSVAFKHLNSKVIPVAKLPEDLLLSIQVC